MEKNTALLLVEKQSNRSIFTSDCVEGGTYLVTGASSGMGKQAAILIALSGGKVIICGRNKERLVDTLKNLPGKLSHCMEVQDLVDADQTAAWIKTITAKNGPLNGIFHAAGLGFTCKTRLTKQSELKTILNSSLFAAFGMANAISQDGVMADEGSFVLMSSVSSIRGSPGSSAYAIAKAGIDSLVRSLACELAYRRIRINSIVAGGVNTPLHEGWINGGGLRSVTEYEDHHLLGFGESQDIAHVVLFLLSKASRWITGTNLIADGGYTIQ